MPKGLARTPEPEVMDEPRGARAYAASDFSDVNRAFVDTLLRLVGPLKSARALDLGTGPGDIPIRVALARPRWRITAVDASGPMLRIARAAAKKSAVQKHITWLRADAKRTALPPRRFDVLFSNSILHHITDVDAFWEELKRVAKPRALVLLRDLARPASRAAARRIVAMYGRCGPTLMQRDYLKSLLASYTLAEVRRQLARHALDTLRVKRVTDRHWDVFGRLP
jgi:ubiquinone/menaquinone biosynthesis C-methylase UbiE